MKTWFTENILMPFGAGIAFAAIMFCGYLVVSEIAIPLYRHILCEKTFFNSDLTLKKQALPIEVVRTHEPEYKWVEYQRDRDTIYLYRVPVAVKIVADSTTKGTGKLILQYSYK